MTGGNYVMEDPGSEIIEKYILPAYAPADKRKLIINCGNHTT